MMNYSGLDPQEEKKIKIEKFQFEEMSPLFRLLGVKADVQYTEV